MSKAYRELLINTVINQISQDVERGDTTAIHEMFNTIHETVLESFLPEAVLDDLIHNKSG